ncbi:PEP-CTERM sorting domain-containing protein [Phycisphaeraceae bacterium D3-23]
MIIRTLLVALPACAIAAAASAGDAAVATYDATTGDLIFDINGQVQLIGVESIGNVRPGEAAGSLTLFGGAVNADATQFDENSIAYFFGANQFFDTGRFEIGPVLATGLGESDITFEYAGADGQSVAGQVIVVPEPGSLALLGLGGLALLRRRR